MKRIIMFGKTGVGKSRTGNIIFGDDSVYASKCQASSLTTASQKHTAFVSGDWVTIVDTPGIFDTESNVNIESEAEKCFELCSPGPNNILLIVCCGRTTKEDFAALKICKDLIGSEICKHSIVVFTHFDDWKRDYGVDGNFQYYIETLPTDFAEFIKHPCGNRCIPFDNTLKGSEAKRQVNDLFFMIDRMLDNNGNSYMSSAMYKTSRKPDTSVYTREHGYIFEKQKTLRELEEERVKMMKEEREKKIQKQFEAIQIYRQLYQRTQVGEDWGTTAFRFLCGAGNIIRIGGTIYSAFNGNNHQPTSNGWTFTPNGIQYNGHF